jgi:tetratricopeptide (TPR) repeat protein
VVHVDPGSANAWLGLAWLAESGQERETFLQQVLAIDPGNAKAQTELDRLYAESGPVPASEKPQGRRLWGWFAVVVALILGAAVLFGAFAVWGPVESSLAWLLTTPTPTATPAPTLTPAQVAAQFVPQLESALSSEHWDRSLELVGIMESVDPSGQGVQEWALKSYTEYGQFLVSSRRVDEALRQFDQALARVPHDAEARKWQQNSQTYLAGRKALDSGQWEAAIQLFTAIFEQMPDYGDAFNQLVAAYRLQAEAAIEAKDWTQAMESLSKARELVPEDQKVVDQLSQAYRERGIVFQKNKKWQKARTDLETALELRPGDEKAKTHYDEVMFILFPPKRIDIDISKQRLYAYEGDKLIYKWVCSTGLRGRDTATGKFQVLDKIKMAYSKVWRLKMPFWLGIYYVGGIENGIHGLPIRPDGSVMWGGLLGQRASYGCIILTNQAARTLYKWADIGTVVDIHH